MHTIEIPDNNKTVEMPSDWDECTPEQSRYLLMLAFNVMAGAISMRDFRIKVFVYLSGLKLGMMYYVKQRLKLNRSVNARIFQLSQQLCGWIFEEPEKDQFELRFETVCNLFPVLLGKYHGPEDLLADVTLGEFKSALSAMDEYFNSKDDEAAAMQYLDLFLSLIYRPKNEEGEKVPFHQNIPDPNVFKRVPLWQKQCIVIWFSFCVKCLQTEELTINGIDVDLSVLFPQDGSGRKSAKTVNLGWSGILLDIAETGVFGDAGGASQTPLYDVLIFLLKKHQDQKAIEHANSKKI